MASTKSTKRARTNGKAKAPVTFTQSEIQRCMHLADTLSKPEFEEMMLPAIKVTWAASCIGGGSDPDIGRKFSVSVDPPADAVYFSIMDGEKKPLGAQLADGLEELATYFKKVASWCEHEASMRRAIDAQLKKQTAA